MRFGRAAAFPMINEGRLKYEAPSTMVKSSFLSPCLEILSSPDEPLPTPMAPPALQTPVSVAVAAAHFPTQIEDYCAICFDVIKAQRGSQLKKCRHSFHDSCIRDYLKHELKCPTCRQDVVGGIPQGRCPSGKMSIHLTEMECPGFHPSARAIQLDYTIPSGTQLSYHDNPGNRYSFTTRTAYLPDNLQGRQLLSRLQYAWMHGLTFSVGTSLTTGRRDSVVWSSIHHKTSLNGGPHGFPDATYIDNCNNALTALGVPPASNADRAIGAQGQTLHYVAPATSLSTIVNIDDMLQPIVQANSIIYPLPSAPLMPMEMNQHRVPTSQPKLTTGRHRPCTPKLEPPSVSSMKFFGQCAICSDPLYGQVCWPKSKDCNHSFHSDCMKVTNGSAPCPICPPKTIAGASAPPCSICLASLSSVHDSCSRIKACGHTFHTDCLAQCLDREAACPKCRQTIGSEPQGTCPSGTMDIQSDMATKCPGYSAKTIRVTYNIAAGKQLTYHKDPGQAFQGTTRTAYLPLTQEGAQLLKRLSYAWMHGLTFTVGTSLTTGLLDVVVWNAAIPHKTSLNGGPFGFPDKDYITKCNKALDALRVPVADDCL